MTRTRRAVLALGSNLGDRQAHLLAAVELLAAHDGVDVVAVSPMYETQAVGGPEQGDYLNAVVLVDTALPALSLLALAQRVERDRHRVRAERWGPRTLDVDLVDVAGERCDSEVLTLPHPRAAERAFVLRPWLDVDPAANLDGVAVRTLLAALPSDLRGGWILPAADALEPQGGDDEGQRGRDANGRDDGI